MTRHATAASTGTVPPDDDDALRADGAPPSGRRLAAVAVAAMAAGPLVAAVLVLGVFAGGSEAVVMGEGLLGLAAGWAVLLVGAQRLTDRPQRWAAVPALVLAAAGAGLLVLRPGDGALTVAGWLWPPAALVLAGWSARAARRSAGRTAWLLYPALGALAIACAGGLAESVTTARDATRFSMPGARYDVGGHRLHLTCTGAGAPTVVLLNGLGEPAALWDGVVAGVSGSTRICAYDRPGQGWSDDLGRAQDGGAVVADLHALLAAAGERGPYLLAGHSSGGTLALTYAARYPGDVAGTVLLDSSSPDQYTAMPTFPRTFAVMRRALPLLPVLARLGALHLAPGSASTALSPAAAAQVDAFASSPRGARNLRDEQSRLTDVFAGAQALRTLGDRPLAVVTSRENSERMAGWAAAQDRMAGLSRRSVHRTVAATHVGLLDDAAGARVSVRAVTAVVAAVRDGRPPVLP